MKNVCLRSYCYAFNAAPDRLPESFFKRAPLL